MIPEAECQSYGSNVESGLSDWAYYLQITGHPSVIFASNHYHQFQNNLAGCDSAGPRLCPERWSPPVSPAPHHRPGLGGHEVGQSEAVSGTVSLPQKH